MATETKYPCKPATVAELEEKFNEYDSSLIEFLHPVTVQELDWGKVYHLLIYNSSYSNGHILKSLLSEGTYANRDGSWVLVLLAKETCPMDYLNHCTSCLQTLRVREYPTLTRLPGLENLTQLTELNLRGCRSLTELPGLKNLTQLTKLNLSLCSSLTTLTGLENLTQLTEMNLTGCSITTLPGLEKFKRLINLNLSGCSSLTALPGLESLTQLTQLNLSDCANLTALPGLENLNQLTRLKLSFCRKLNALPGLENLTQLTQLDLSSCRNLHALPGLENLTQLTELDLSFCRNLHALPGLENLNQLTQLNLSFCSNLHALPGLEHLNQLTQLNLSDCSKLNALPGLENLKQLTQLNLSCCANLTALPGLENLTQLTELDLSCCTNLKEVPPSLRILASLRRLDFSEMDLCTLPVWLPEIAEKFTRDWNYIDGASKAIVSLKDTTVEDIPDMSIFDQPFEVIEEFFRQRREGQTQMLNEIKVVFLGDGEAGKSHTIARLMNDGGKPIGYVDVRTPGIVIKDKVFPVSDRDATLHFWDFGGQDIMHSMHRIFLTERTIYVVLVDASIGNQDERARYWLSNIQSFAKDAPVVLVLNKLDDELQADVNAVDLHNKYKGLKRIVKLSAKQYTQERFNREFRDVLLEEIEKTKYLDSTWPIEWINVKKSLEQMDDNYIHGGKYLEICQKLNVDKNQKPLLRWFHDLGISFCYCDEENGALEDYVVLKPNWITNALYIILFNEREGANGGLVPLSTIRSMLSWDAPNKDAIKRVIPDAYYVGYDVNYVLDVFHVFKLSFRKDDQYEFFPMLADVNAKPVAKEYADDAECLEFTMAFDYQLPNNLLHRLMVERHSELDMDNVWRTGAKFQLTELGLSAVVVIDGNDLRFFIRHDNDTHRPNTYLTMLKANVDRIVEKMGLKAPTCQLIYKLDGKRDVFDFEMLKAMQEAGQSQVFSMTWRRMMPIEAILNQSAPDGLEDEQKLLDTIRQSCLYIQGDPIYYLKGGETGRGMEDNRNRRIRDDLEMLGYTVKDQTQRGLSGTGRGVGELDLLLYNDRKEPWTIIEALRVSSGAKTQWNEHLDKLLQNYNYFGAPCVYLLTYVDADAGAFENIWKGYLDHIPRYAPGKFTYCAESLVVQKSPTGPQDIQTAKCIYRYNGRETTAYHIFARIPTRN